MFVSNGIALVFGVTIVGFFFIYSNLNVDGPVVGLLVACVNDVLVLVLVTVVVGFDCLLIFGVVRFDCLPIFGVAFLNLGSFSNNLPASDKTSCRPLCNADAIIVLSVSSCIEMPCSFSIAYADAFIGFISSEEVAGNLNENLFLVRWKETKINFYISKRIQKPVIMQDYYLSPATIVSHPCRRCSINHQCPQ